MVPGSISTPMLGLIAHFHATCRHYIVHTRYLPTSSLAKRIRMHHLLHHTKNEAYWLAFTVPQVSDRRGMAICEIAVGQRPSGMVLE